MNIEKSRQGFIPVDVAMDEIQKMQEDTARLEGRLRLLINSSAKLRANSDLVNQIEEDLQRSKVVLEFSRNAVSIEMTRQLTGAGAPIPDDVMLFNELSK